LDLTADGAESGHVNVEHLAGLRIDGDEPTEIVANRFEAKDAGLTGITTP
jgi:hypothetical protein